jgi:hypothetical protein
MRRTAKEHAQAAPLLSEDSRYTGVEAPEGRGKPFRWGRGDDSCCRSTTGQARGRKTFPTKSSIRWA